MTFMKPCCPWAWPMTLKAHVLKALKLLLQFCITSSTSGAPLRPHYQLLSVWYQFAAKWNYNAALCSVASQCLRWMGGLHCCVIGRQRALEWWKTQRLLYCDGFASSECWGREEEGACWLHVPPFESSSHPSAAPSPGFSLYCVVTASVDLIVNTSWQAEACWNLLYD